MLTLKSLLLPFGFEPAIPTKLVRHQDQRFNVQELYRLGQFEFYQQVQSKLVFADCNRIISFLGWSGTYALLVGIYDVLSVDGPKDCPAPVGYLYPNHDTTNHYRYELRRDKRFSELQNRLVIDWGAGTRSWVQHYRNGEKPVVEVLPKGFVREFPGFMAVMLRHAELVAIVKNPIPHRDWHRMLKSVAGIYLILDSKTGNQYVGSAYGEDGLLGRWRSYADSVHGGNKQLRQLVESRPDVAHDLQFSILQTLPNTLTAKEVIDYETVHKRKLGTRAHGLNSN